MMESAAEREAYRTWRASHTLKHEQGEEERFKSDDIIILINFSGMKFGSQLGTNFAYTRFSAALAGCHAVPGVHLQIIQVMQPSQVFINCAPHADL